nr:MAG TPA: hypothetical protein [Caudoviricetes sp.]
MLSSCLNISMICISSTKITIFFDIAIFIS